jgi:hypothetical protein
MFSLCRGYDHQSWAAPSIPLTGPRDSRSPKKTRRVKCNIIQIHFPLTQLAEEGLLNDVYKRFSLEYAAVFISATNNQTDYSAPFLMRYLEYCFKYGYSC